MTDQPASARGLTVSEKRSIGLERFTLWGVFFVSLLAAYISFLAQVWVGQRMGFGAASFALPLCIDGFAVVCAVNVRAPTGEHARGRVSEWAGLFFALSLSVAGNVEHALVVGDATMPRPLLITVGAGIPMLVAWGFHVLGRSMARGLSAHVMADNRATIQMHVQQVGEPARKPRAKSAGVPVQVRVQSAPEPVQSPHVPTDRGKSAMRAEFLRIVRADPDARPRAVDLHASVGATCDPATSRRWVAGWAAELEAEQVRAPHLVAAAGG